MSITDRMIAMKNLAFMAVCQFFGSQVKTAQILNVSNRMVNHVVQGRRPMPNEWAPIIEEASGGKFLCEELAPNVKWGVIANRRARHN